MRTELEKAYLHGRADAHWDIEHGYDPRAFPPYDYHGWRLRAWLNGYEGVLASKYHAIVGADA